MRFFSVSFWDDQMPSQCTAIWEKSMKVLTKNLFVHAAFKMAEKQTVGDALPSVPNNKQYGRVVISLENCLLPEERLVSTPSSNDGLDPETEMDLRILGCELIQTAGILLRLPQVVVYSILLRPSQRSFLLLRNSKFELCIRFCYKVQNVCIDGSRLRWPLDKYCFTDFITASRLFDNPWKLLPWAVFVVRQKLKKLLDVLGMLFLFSSTLNKFGLKSKLSCVSLNSCQVLIIFPIFESETWRLWFLTKLM